MLRLLSRAQSCRDKKPYKLHDTILVGFAGWGHHSRPKSKGACFAVNGRHVRCRSCPFAPTARSPATNCWRRQQHIPLQSMAEQPSETRRGDGGLVPMPCPVDTSPGPMELGGHGCVASRLVQDPWCRQFKGRGPSSGPDPPSNTAIWCVPWTPPHYRTLLLVRHLYSQAIVHPAS